MLFSYSFCLFLVIRKKNFPLKLIYSYKRKNGRDQTINLPRILKWQAKDIYGFKALKKREYAEDAFFV